MDPIKKQWMDKALKIVEAGLAGEKVQTAIQLRLVSSIASELEKAWNDGLDAGEDIENDECDDAECDDCLNAFEGSKFKKGQKVKAVRKNWSQLARDMYSKETYTITNMSRNDADEIEHELTSDLYTSEKTIIRENDPEWEIYAAL